MEVEKHDVIIIKLHLRMHNNDSEHVRGRAHVMIGAALRTGRYCSKYWSLQSQAPQQPP